MKTVTLTSQRGVSVTTIVFMLIAIGLLAKLGTAIVPSYVGDYQLNKLIQEEITKANEAKASEKQFKDSLSTQLSINANYNTKVDDVLVMTNKTPGSLAVRTRYIDESNFYGSTFIVNRYSAEINSQGIKKVPYEAPKAREKFTLQ